MVIRTRLYHTLNSLDFRRKSHHFIHIPKNGGRSVRDALTLRRVALELPLHSRYRDLEIRAELRYFCTVRNPWSRTASRYLYMKVNSREWSNDDPRKKYIMIVSFDDYVREQRVFSIPQQPERPWPLSLWINQLEWITDHDGHVAGDCLRLETIDEDISAYFGRRIKVPHRQSVRTGTYDYRTLYTPKTIQIVADTFAKDVDYFGFDFDGSATRNTFTLM
jgi:hypothetical protein